MSWGTVFWLVVVATLLSTWVSGMIYMMGYHAYISMVLSKAGKEKPESKHIIFSVLLSWFSKGVTDASQAIAIAEDQEFVGKTLTTLADAQQKMTATNLELMITYKKVIETIANTGKL